MIEVPREDEIKEIIDEETAPPEFLCPVTLEIMRDPVMASDGITYERVLLENWINRNKQNPTSPLTGAPLKSSSFFTNKALKLAIQRHNKRLKKIEEDTLKNKGQLLKFNCENIKNDFPQLTDPSGFIQVEKIYELLESYQTLRKTAETMRKNWDTIKKKLNSTCQECEIAADGKSYMRTIKKEVDPVLQKIPSYDEMLKEIKVEQIKYIILSEVDVRKIKSKKMKQAELKIQVLKGIKFQNTTIKEIKRRIKYQNSNVITNDHLMRVWKSDKGLSQLFNHLSFDDKSAIEESEYCRIENVGQKLVSKSKIREVGLKKQQFFIVQYYN